MSERGMNHFLKALKYFVRSFKPANIRTNAVLVGTDHIGNKYFEVKADPAKGNRRPSRFYKPVHSEHWDTPLPPEWNSWLRLQRDDPPTQEEQQWKLARIQKLQEQFPKTSTDPKTARTGTFPRYEEYEEQAGSKYK